MESNLKVSSNEVSANIRSYDTKIGSSTIDTNSNLRSMYKVIVVAVTCIFLFIKNNYDLIKQDNCLFVKNNIYSDNKWLISGVQSLRLCNVK